MILGSFEKFLCTMKLNVFTIPRNWGGQQKIRKYWRLWPAFHPAHLDASPGAHNYAIDPLSYRASSVQPIHLWALQLSELSQPHCCEWQLVQHRNLSGSKIPAAMSQSPTVPISHLDREGPSEVDRVVKGVQLALGIYPARLSLAGQGMLEVYLQCWQHHLHHLCELKKNGFTLSNSIQDQGKNLKCPDTWGGKRLRGWDEMRWNASRTKRFLLTKNLNPHFTYWIHNTTHMCSGTP